MRKGIMRDLGALTRQEHSFRDTMPEGEVLMADENAKAPPGLTAEEKKKVEEWFRQNAPNRICNALSQNA
jgi:hypothetical protein